MNNAFDISNDEFLKRSDKSATTKPPPPCDGSKVGDFNERINRLNPLRKTRARLSPRNTVLTGLAAMICLLPTVTYAQIEAGKLFELLKVWWNGFKALNIDRPFERHEDLSLVTSNRESHLPSISYFCFHDSNYYVHFFSDSHQHLTSIG